MLLTVKDLDVQGRRSADYKKYLQVWSESAVACDEEEEECSHT